MMIYYLVLFTSFFLIALIIRLNRFVFYSLAKNSVALVNELIADIDEDLKIKQVQKGTNKLVLLLGKMVLVFVLAIVVGSIPVVIFCFVARTDFNSLVFSSFTAILFISLGATVPFIVPMGNKNISGYSELSQLLHRMALDNFYIANKLFKRETRKIKKRNLERQQCFVIISGLARAGTTSLMNDLAGIEKFVSLSYANMPFLMCPNIWAKLYKPKNTGLKERSHKDGIKIGLNSNEALEEYFFKVKANDAYIKEDSLLEYELSQEDYNDYLDYQTIVKLDDSKIYLAKNNNFILRYNSVRQFNDEFIMVILYRDPFTHAASLMEKHNEYKQLQAEDPFVLEYMNWLGHHEFGNNQKPFIFHDVEANFLSDKESLDYWLKIWINYYSYVLTFDHPNTILINYDSYCKNPKGTIGNIISKTGISADLSEYQSFINTRKVNIKASKDISDQALELYNLLREKSDRN